MPHLDLLPSTGVLAVEIVVQPTVAVIDATIFITPTAPSTNTITVPIDPDGGVNGTPAPPKPK